jgi:DNA primase
VIDQAVRDRNLQNPADKAAAVEEMLPFVRAVSSRIQKREYFDIAMDSLRVQQDQQRELWQAVRGGASRNASSVQTVITRRVQPTVAEEKLLGLLVTSEELRKIMLPRLESTDYEGLATAELFRVLIALDKDDKKISFDSLSEATSDSSMAAELLPRLMMNETLESFDESLTAAQENVKALKLMSVERMIDELKAKKADAQRADDAETVQRLAMEQLEWMKRRNDLLGKIKATSAQGPNSIG